MCCCVPPPVSSWHFSGLSSQQYKHRSALHPWKQVKKCIAACKASGGEQGVLTQRRPEGSGCALIHARPDAASAACSTSRPAMPQKPGLICCPSPADTVTALRYDTVNSLREHRPWCLDFECFLCEAPVASELSCVFRPLVPAIKPYLDGQSCLYYLGGL